MAIPDKIQVFSPGNLSELFSLWNRFPGAVLHAGGTSIIHNGSDKVGGMVFAEQPELLPEILSLVKIEELRSISRTERHLEIGAMVRLGEIIALGKIVPGAFSRTLQGIANPQVRNLATIGGNICAGGDTTAPLCALDAVYELRNAGGSRWISALRFSLAPGHSTDTVKIRASLPDTLHKGEILSRIRIPLEKWNYTVYRKFRTIHSGDEGGVLVLVVKNQKNILTKIQVVFIKGAHHSNGTLTGNTRVILLRDKGSESELEGKALPLERRDVALYRKNWETYLEGLENPGPELRNKIINAVETGIAGLSD